MKQTPRIMLARWHLLTSSLLLVIFLNGCGYHLGHVKPTAYARIQRIHIPTFQNKTQEPRSAVLVSNAVIQQFQRDGTYQIANSNQADAILDATIETIDRRQARSARFDTLRTSELDFTLEVKYQFRDLRTNEVLDQGTIEGRVSQFLDPNFQLSERQALPLAAEKLAENLVSRLSEGW